MFEFMAPAVTADEVKEAAAQAGPRQLAPKGKYKVRLHSMRGRVYEKDGQTRDLASLFFINLDGNYKGAELALFRVGGNPASTTSQQAVIAIGLAAGLTPEEISTLNWAVDTSNPVDDKGNVAAAFGTPARGAISVEGLEFMASIDEETNENTGYTKNVIKGLRVAK